METWKVNLTSNCYKSDTDVTNANIKIRDCLILMTIFIKIPIFSTAQLLAIKVKILVLE